MGDLIQSTALFKKIRLIYPESRVKLLISKEFADIAPFLPYVDEIKPINVTELSEILKANNFDLTIDVLKALGDMFDGILQVNYDLAVNLSHDEFSVYFLYMLNSLKNIGISVNREGTIISNDEMIAYIFSAVKNRKVSVLNLVDLYERTIKTNKTQYKQHVNKIFLDAKKNNEEHDGNKEFEVLKKYGIEESDNIVSFAIGASTELKKWRYDYFAELAKMFLNGDIKTKVVLLGAKYDVKAGGFIESIVANERLINLTGKTSVADLVYIVRRSNLLITHDTGTMHIGVAVGTKLIVIYTGNVGFLETGPYAENRLLVIPDIGCFPCDFNLKCLNPVCQGLIKPEYIYDMSLMLLKNETGYTEKLYKYKNTGIVPYLSRFDSKKFIDYLPAVKIKLNFKDFKLKILKLALEHYYEGDFWNIDENEIELFLDCFEGIEYNLSLDIEEELKSVENLIVLCKRGMSETKKMINLALKDPFNSNSIEESTGNIKSIDFELKYISSVYDDLSLFNQIYVINQNSSVSYDLFGLALDSLKCYSKYKIQLNIFKKVSLIVLDKIKNL